MGRWGVAAWAALTMGGAAPALAQGDPMEEQHCVWRCLEASRGASDPAYDACVQARCSGRPAPRGGGAAAPPSAPRPAAQGWRQVEGLAYPAVGTCQGEMPCLLVSCPAQGRLAMEVYARGDAWRPGQTMRLRLGGEVFRATLPDPEGSPRVFRWPVSPGMLEALKAGSAVALETEGASVPLSLAGSSRVIGGLEDRCR